MIGARTAALVKGKVRKGRKKDASFQHHRGSRAHLFGEKTRQSRLTMMEKQGGSLFQVLDKNKKLTQARVSSSGRKERTDSFEESFWTVTASESKTLDRKQSILQHLSPEDIPNLARPSSLIMLGLTRKESIVVQDLAQKASVAEMSVEGDDEEKQKSAVMRSVTMFERKIIANKDNWAKGFKRRSTARINSKRHLMPTVKAKNPFINLVKTYYITPDSFAHTAWDCLIIAFVLYNAFALPYALAFDPNRKIGALQTLDTTSDAFFWLDLILNFFVAFRDPWGALITNRRQIAVHYLQGWFWVDFPACFPFEVFSSNESGNINIGSNMLKCFRLLRMAKIFRYLDRIRNFANASRMIRILGQVILTCHWIGCFWFFLGESMKAQGSSCVLVPTSTVLIAVRTDGSSHMTQFCMWLAIHGLDLPTASTMSKYLKSLYWAVSSLTSIGYGDIVPVTAWECFYAVLTVVIGAGIYASVFSNFVSYVSQNDLMSIKYTEKIGIISSQMNYLNLPEPLQEKIRMYFDYLWTRHKGLVDHGVEFYKELPPPLEKECARELHYKTLAKCPSFKQCSSPFISELLVAMIPMISVPYQVIIHEGTIGNALYFVGTGLLYVYRKSHFDPSMKTKDDTEIAQKMSSSKGFGLGLRAENRVGWLFEGDIFGETSILAGAPITATIVTVSYCDLYYVSLDVFRLLLTVYPKDRDAIVKAALEFLDTA